MREDTSRQRRSEGVPGRGPPACPGDRLRASNATGRDGMTGLRPQTKLWSPSARARKLILLMRFRPSDPQNWFGAVIAYYGAALSGKTTNLHAIHRRLR